MSPKGPVKNVAEALKEPVWDATRNVKKQVDNFPHDLVRMLYVDPSHEFRSEEELNAIERREKMEGLEGYKRARRELDAMQGKVTSEISLDDETRRRIEEEEKRLTESLQRFEATSREAASALGPPKPEQEAQAEKQKEAASEQEGQRKKAEEQTRIETHVEAPHGIESGPSLFIKFKRRKNPLRGAPRATAELRGAETRTNGA